MVRAIILVAIGGGIGSALRYLTSVFVGKYFHTLFPLATFIANILGCLIIGFLFGLFERYNQTNYDLRSLFITGFCGGYTTFSAFASENVNLFQSGHHLMALAYVAASVLVGSLAVWFGMMCARL